MGNGFSDISTLLFPLTLLTGIVSVHGTNLLEMIPAQTDQLTKDCLLVLTKEQGSTTIEKASEFFQIKGPSLRQNLNKVSTSQKKIVENT